MMYPSAELAETDGGPIELGPSMWSVYEHGIDRSQGRFAIISAEQDREYLEHLVGPSHHDLHCLAWTYAQMRRGAARLAATFQAYGILPGSIIALLITNSADWALLTWTAAIGRYCIEFIDPRAVELAKAGQLAYAFTTLKPSLIVVDNGSGASIVQEAASTLSVHVRLGICLHPDPEIPPGWKLLKELAQENHGETVAPLSDNMERIATYMFTSGTSSGHPKGVPRTVENWLTATTNRSMMPISEHTVTCLTSMCFRIIANNLSMCVWYSGGTVVVPDGMSTWGKTLDAIEKFKVNLLLSGIYQLFAILETRSFSADKVRSIRQIFVGSDVVTTQLIDQWRTRFPERSIVNRYGMTEATGAVGWGNASVPDPVPTHQNVTALGKAGPGTKLRIVNLEGHVARRGEPGELHIGGGLAIPAYLGIVQSHHFYSDGRCRWMRTGDTAVIDTEGHLFVIGRTKDIIKKYGVPVCPSSIESCLSRYTGVRTQVVGIPDETAGEQPYAIIDHFPPGTSVKQLGELIVESFGLEYSLKDVLALDAIGMTGWPKGGFDKVIKKDLVEAVVNYLDARKDLLI